MKKHLQSRHQSHHRSLVGGEVYFEWPFYMCQQNSLREIFTHVKTPAIIPAQPSPDIARPTIRAGEVGAVPHIKEPISKMATAVKKTYLTEKILYNLPNLRGQVIYVCLAAGTNMNWNAQLVSRLKKLERFSQEHTRLTRPSNTNPRLRWS